jgi:hypothetical protein
MISTEFSTAAVPSKSSVRHWILPIVCVLPMIFGIFGVLFKSAGDEGGSEMAVAFFFFPISFCFGVLAAVRVWKNRKTWSRLDKAIGFAPLTICLAMILFVIAAVVFDWNF